MTGRVEIAARLGRGAAAAQSRRARCRGVVADGGRNDRDLIYEGAFGVRAAGPTAPAMTLDTLFNIQSMKQSGGPRSPRRIATGRARQAYA